MAKPDLAHHLTDKELAALEKRIAAKTEGITVTENDVYELIGRLGRDADKSFAEAAGDSLRKLIGRLSKYDSSLIGYLVMHYGLECAMEMLESALNLAEVANEA